MKIILTFISSVMLLLSAGSNASAFYCGNKIIQAGLTKGEVRSWCGKPTFEDRRDEDRLEKTGNDEEDIVLRISVDEWMYNFGPDKFIQILIFEKGRLRHIRAGEYGWTLIDKRKKDCTSASLLLGVSKSEIFVKCGPPDEKDSWQKSYRRDKGSAKNQRITQTFEDWIYNRGDGKGLVFKFIDGKLVSVNTID